MSAPEFAAFIGVKYQTLATWLQKRRRKGAGTVAASVASAFDHSAFGEHGEPAGVVRTFDDFDVQPEPQIPKGYS